MYCAMLNPVMRLKDSLQFDDFFYIISFWSKRAHFWPALRPQLNGFPSHVPLLLLNLLQFEEFFCVCVLPFSNNFYREK